MYIKTFFKSVTEAIDLKDGQAAIDMQTRIDYVIQVANGLAEAVGTMGDASHPEYLEQLGFRLRGFGHNVGEFMDQLDSKLVDTSLDRIHALSEFMTGLGSLMRGVSSMFTGTYNRTPDQIKEYIGICDELGLGYSIDPSNDSQNEYARVITVTKNGKVLGRINSDAKTDVGERPSIGWIIGGGVLIGGAAVLGLILVLAVTRKKKAA